MRTVFGVARLVAGVENILGTGFATGSSSQERDANPHFAQGGDRDVYEDEGTVEGT